MLNDNDGGNGHGDDDVAVFDVVLGGTFNVWISIQFARGSPFYYLTVAKDRGP